MSNKFSYYQRQQLKQSVIEIEVIGLQINEALAYIKVKTGLSISPEYVYGLKRIIRHDAGKRLNQLQADRNLYLYQFFKRIDEIEKYKQELWTTILTNQEDGYLKKACIAELHQLTITQANLYEMLPEYSINLAVNTQTTTENRSQQEEETTISRPVF
jgi:hypothetical protein